MKEDSYQDHIDFLRESFQHLSDAAGNSGHNKIQVNRILKGLYNPDPFVMLQASIAATTLLDEQTTIH